MIKIIRQPKGKVKLVGYNSDIIGFSQSIQPLLQPHHKKALILGTGGASKAVYHGLKNLGIESVFVSRTHKADNMLTYEELTPEIMAEHTMIVTLSRRSPFLTPYRSRNLPIRGAMRLLQKCAAIPRSATVSAPIARSSIMIHGANTSRIRFWNP